MDFELTGGQVWNRGIARPGHEWSNPREIAHLIVFAASERASFINDAALSGDGSVDKS